MDGKTASGDIPFYDLPYMDLRGIPAMRYQDKNVVVGEMEARWDFTTLVTLTGR